VKILSLFHPLFQCLSFATGAYNARMGLVRRNFTYKRHLRFGLLYYGMSTLGFLIYYRPRMRAALMPIHKYLNLASLLLFVLQGVTGFSALFRSFLS